jgi:hypothetical protein
VRAPLAAAVLVAALALSPPPAPAATGSCRPWKARTVARDLGLLENLEFDGRGGMILSNIAHGAIERLMPDGRVTTLAANVNAPGGLRVGGRTLYFNTGDSLPSGQQGIADGTIDRLDLRTGARTTWARGLTMPNGLLLLRGGDALVSRDIGPGTGITRVPRRDPAAIRTNWAALDDTNGLALDPRGRWLYADRTFAKDSPVVRISLAHPRRVRVIARLHRRGPLLGLDDMTIDRAGVLYIAANGGGQVIRLDTRTRRSCVIARRCATPPRSSSAADRAGTRGACT